MNPCELNAFITSVTNLLYATLSEKDFKLATVLISELSKSMFSLQLLRSVCDSEEK